MRKEDWDFEEENPEDGSYTYVQDTDDEEPLLSVDIVHNLSTEDINNAHRADLKGTSKNATRRSVYTHERVD